MFISREANHICMNQVSVPEKYIFFFPVLAYLFSLIFILGFATYAKLGIKFLDAKNVEMHRFKHYIKDFFSSSKTIQQLYLDPKAICFYPFVSLG